jgi:hypothetical protein
MQRTMCGGVLVCLLVWVAMVIPQLAHGTPASPGDFLVIDYDAGTGGRGALFAVDPATGSRIIVSDFGNPIDGALGADPFGIVLWTAGAVLVADPFAGTANRGALFSVDLVSGSRVVVSDFGNAAQGPLGAYTIGVVVAADGTILVVDGNAGTATRGAVFTVDPVTGARTILSDFGDATQGPLGVTPIAITLDASGQILVADLDDGSGNLGALFRVDPATGARTLVSNFGDVTQGPLGFDPLSVGVDASGRILVADQHAGTSSLGALFTVDPSTGARIVLSDFGDVTQGPLGFDPTSLTFDASGTIWLMDNQAASGLAGALFKVDPATGARQILSDFSDPIKGPTGVNPSGLVIFGAGGPPPDTAAPDTTITQAVDGKNKAIADGAKTGSTAIKFRFTGTDDAAVAGFQCSLDGGAFSACSSPLSYATVGSGAHTFQVRAVDTSGNVDPSPALFSWFVSGNKIK